MHRAVRERNFRYTDGHCRFVINLHGVGRQRYQRDRGELQRHHRDHHQRNLHVFRDSGQHCLRYFPLNGFYLS